MIATFISELLGTDGATGIGGAIDRTAQTDGLGTAGGAGCGCGTGTYRREYVAPLLDVTGNADGGRVGSATADTTGTQGVRDTIDVPAPHLSLAELDYSTVQVQRDCGGRGRAGGCGRAGHSQRTVGGMERSQSRVRSLDVVRQRCVQSAPR